MSFCITRSYRRNGKVINKIKEIYISKLHKDFGGEGPDYIQGDSGDISEHLGTLKQYAEECRHITELGVDQVVSTWALLYGLLLSTHGGGLSDTVTKTLVSIDIAKCPIGPLKLLASKTDVNFTFIQADDLTITIDLTDLLFIDSSHNPEHLLKELNLHGNKVSKYIILHDSERRAQQPKKLKRSNEQNQSLRMIESVLSWIINGYVIR